MSRGTGCLWSVFWFVAGILFVAFFHSAIAIVTLVLTLLGVVLLIRFFVWLKKIVG